MREDKLKQHAIWFSLLLNILFFPHIFAHSCFNLNERSFILFNLISKIPLQDFPKA